MSSTLCSTPSRHLSVSPSGEYKPSSSSVSACRRCTCCPYGYHIDVDFVDWLQAERANTARLDKLKKIHSQRRATRLQLESTLLLGAGTSTAQKVQLDSSEEDITMPPFSAGCGSPPAGPFCDDRFSTVRRSPGLWSGAKRRKVDQLGGEERQGVRGGKAGRGVGEGEGGQGQLDLSKNVIADKISFARDVMHDVEDTIADAMVYIDGIFIDGRSSTPLASHENKLLSTASHPMQRRTVAGEKSMSSIHISSAANSVIGTSASHAAACPTCDALWAGEMSRHQVKPEVQEFHANVFSRPNVDVMTRSSQDRMEDAADGRDHFPDHVTGTVLSRKGCEYTTHNAEVLDRSALSEQEPLSGSEFNSLEKRPLTSAELAHAMNSLIPSGIDTSDASGALIASPEDQEAEADSLAVAKTTTAAAGTRRMDEAALNLLRHHIATSLQQMRRLEYEARAVPILQVRLSLLKEEKRLLQLQLLHNLRGGAQTSATTSNQQKSGHETGSRVTSGEGEENEKKAVQLYREAHNENDHSDVACLQQEMSQDSLVTVAIPNRSVGNSPITYQYTKGKVQFGNGDREKANSQNGNGMVSTDCVDDIASKKTRESSSSTVSQYLIRKSAASRTLNGKSQAFDTENNSSNVVANSASDTNWYIVPLFRGSASVGEDPAENYTKLQKSKSSPVVQYGGKTFFRNRAKLGSGPGWLGGLAARGGGHRVVAIQRKPEKTQEAANLTNKIAESLDEINDGNIRNSEPNDANIRNSEPNDGNIRNSEPIVGDPTKIDTTPVQSNVNQTGSIMDNDTTRQAFHAMHTEGLRIVKLTKLDAIQEKPPRIVIDDYKLKQSPPLGNELDSDAHSQKITDIESLFRGRTNSSNIGDFSPDLASKPDINLLFRENSSIQLTSVNQSLSSADLAKAQYIANREPLGSCQSPSSKEYIPRAHCPHCYHSLDASYMGLHDPTTVHYSSEKSADRGDLTNVHFEQISLFNEGSVGALAKITKTDSFRIYLNKRSLSEADMRKVTNDINMKSSALSQIYQSGECNVTANFNHTESAADGSQGVAVVAASSVIKNCCEKSTNTDRVRIFSRSSSLQMDKASLTMSKSVDKISSITTEPKFKYSDEFAILVATRKIHPENNNASVPSKPSVLTDNSCILERSECQSPPSSDDGSASEGSADIGEAELKAYDALKRIKVKKGKTPTHTTEDSTMSCNVNTIINCDYVTGTDSHEFRKVCFDVGTQYCNPAEVINTSSALTKNDFTTLQNKYGIVAVETSQTATLSNIIPAEVNRDENCEFSITHEENLSKSRISADVQLVDAAVGDGLAIVQLINSCTGDSLAEVFHSDMCTGVELFETKCANMSTGDGLAEIKHSDRATGDELAELKHFDMSTGDGQAEIKYSDMLVGDGFAEILCCDMSTGDDLAESLYCDISTGDSVAKIVHCNVGTGSGIAEIRHSDMCTGDELASTKYCDISTGERSVVYADAGHGEEVAYVKHYDICIGDELAELNSIEAECQTDVITCTNFGCGNEASLCNCDAFVQCYLQSSLADKNIGTDFPTTRSVGIDADFSLLENYLTHAKPATSDIGVSVEIQDCTTLRPITQDAACLANIVPIKITTNNVATMTDFLMQKCLTSDVACITDPYPFKVLSHEVACITDLQKASTKEVACFADWKPEKESTNEVACMTDSYLLKIQSFEIACLTDPYPLKDIGCGTDFLPEKVQTQDTACITDQYPIKVSMKDSACITEPVTKPETKEVASLTDKWPLERQTEDAGCQSQPCTSDASSTAENRVETQDIGSSTDPIPSLTHASSNTEPRLATTDKECSIKPTTHEVYCVAHMAPQTVDVACHAQTFTADAFSNTAEPPTFAHVACDIKPVTADVHCAANIRLQSVDVACLVKCEIHDAACSANIKPLASDVASEVKPSINHFACDIRPTTRDAETFTATIADNTCHEAVMTDGCNDIQQSDSLMPDICRETRHFNFSEKFFRDSLVSSSQAGNEEINNNDTQIKTFPGTLSKSTDAYEVGHPMGTSNQNKMAAAKIPVTNNCSLKHTEIGPVSFVSPTTSSSQHIISQDSMDDGSADFEHMKEADTQLQKSPLKRAGSVRSRLPVSKKRSSAALDESAASSRSAVNRSERCIEKDDFSYQVSKTNPATPPRKFLSSRSMTEHVSNSRGSGMFGDEFSHREYDDSSEGRHGHAKVAINKASGDVDNTNWASRRTTSYMYSEPKAALPKVIITAAGKLNAEYSDPDTNREDDEEERLERTEQECLERNVHENEEELNDDLVDACLTYAQWLQDSTEVNSKQLNASLQVIQDAWFSISSCKKASKSRVAWFLRAIENMSSHVTLSKNIINMADINGNTALHYAVSQSNFSVARLLLDTDQCDVTRANKSGCTALMLAVLVPIATEDQEETLWKMMKMGDVDLRASMAGQTALMLAASRDRHDAVRMLLEAGCDVNTQDDDGSTALMTATEHGYIEVVRTLLAHPDCDPSIADNEGSTALSVAMEAGHRDIGVLLYAHINYRNSKPGSFRKKGHLRRSNSSIKST